MSKLKKCSYSCSKIFKLYYTRILVDKKIFIPLFFFTVWYVFSVVFVSVYLSITGNHFLAWSALIPLIGFLVFYLFYVKKFRKKSPHVIVFLVVVLFILFTFFYFIWPFHYEINIVNEKEYPVVALITITDHNGEVVFNESHHNASILLWKDNYTISVVSEGYIEQKYVLV